MPVLSAPVLPERLWRRRELLCSAAKGRQSSSPEAMMDKTSVGQSHHRHSLRYFACLTSSISEAKACLRDEAVKQVRFVLENVCQLLCSLLSCPLLLLFKGELLFYHSFSYFLISAKKLYTLFILYNLFVLF